MLATNNTNNDDLTTQEFANLFKVQPDTVRRSYCLNGHYCGIVPKKLPNRLLIWPAQKAHDVRNGSTKKTSTYDGE